jgi:hypothetical protein
MIAQSISSLLDDKVALELEALDRLYLNGYVPQLQTPEGFVGFVHRQLELPIPATPAVAPMSHAFVAAIKKFAADHEIPMVTFHKGERKDDVAKEHFATFQGHEGVVFIGKAQEKTRVLRTVRRTNPQTNKTYPWIVLGSAMVNHFYFYIWDRDFGPLFIKFGTYFPYPVKVCLNGNERLKRQLAQRGITFEALDNGILSCDDPNRAQRISNELNAKKIDRLFRKWLARLPHPFRPKDVRAGYRYKLSILQAEFSLTQVFHQPRHGRAFFEQVIRDNIDIGRPDRVQLIFSRRISRRTPGSFRTRIITHGVIPSLHVQYKSSRIKQYYKEGRALRTETTINNTTDFGIRKALDNLPALQEIGYQANRRLLDVQCTSHDCTIGHQRFASITQPLVVHNQRASALRFADPRVMALMTALCVFRLSARGFCNRDLRELTAQLLGLDPAHAKPGSMTYDLRRLRLHGLIERIPHSHRYIVTDQGLRSALFFSLTYQRLFPTVLSLRKPPHSPRRELRPKKLPPSFIALVRCFDKLLEQTNLAA